MAFSIARFWNRDPYWFYSLDRELRNKLIADYRIYHESKEQFDKRKEKYNDKKLQDLIDGN